LSKKIIHQVSLSEIGGVQRSFSLYFSYALKKSRFKHFVYSNYDIIDNFINVKNYHFNLRKSLIQKVKFLYYLISRNYIIHFYNNLGSKSVKKLINIFPSSNIIFHERGSAWNAKEEDIKIYRYNASVAKIVLVNSLASKIMLTKRFGVNEDKIKIIHNGFLSKFTNFLPTKKRYSKKFCVGYLGRLDTPKGVHVFINSAKQLPYYDFFIAGQGPLENVLKKLAKNYKNINFLGSVKDPLEFISQMDTMVVPSIREPLGNSVIEAGYCKKSVIAANVDGIPEIIKDKHSGILINPDKEITFRETTSKSAPFPNVVVNSNQQLQEPKEIDTSKLCDSIVFLASNLKIRESYGENLNKSVIKKFNIENYYETLENLYNQFK